MSLDSEKGKREKTQNPKPKTQNPPSITAQTVKGALAQGEAGLVELCTRLDIPEADSKGRDQVRKILRDLENFHQIKVDAKKGIWIYRLTDKPGARGAVQAKLWKFACHRLQKGYTFTAAEAAAMAGCDRDYAKRYCRWLWAAGYLALASRGRAGALLYRVVAGKEKESAPHWNRRAEKRENSGLGSWVKGQKKTPPSPPFPKGGEVSPAEDHRPEACATISEKRLKAVLDEFGQSLVEIAGGHGRAVEIVQQMKDTILAVREQGHDEPTESHRE